jgi:hypothetical protein
MTPSMPDDPSTQELKQVQRRREAGERDAAGRSPTGKEARTHARRADRAAYLSEKLEERERSERASGVSPAPPDENEEER